MFSKLNSKLENLFDENSTPHFLTDPGLIAARKNFQTVDNVHLLENLSYVFSEEVTEATLPNLFSQLCSYFEIGYMQTKKGQSITLYGKPWALVASTETLKLPQTPLFKVFTTSGSLVLSHFKIDELDPAKKMQSYMVRIADGHYFVFVSATAEPWARLRLEALQNTLMKINFNL
jgi:hypothetical protein